MPPSSATPGLLRLAACEVDLVRGEVRRDGDSLGLTTREQQLLAYLAARPGEEVSREALLTEVWGYAPSAESRTVDSTVARLRRKIEEDPTEPAHLLTVWGSGYRLVPAWPEAPAPSPPRTNLRPALDPFVGRTEALARVLSSWGAGGRLVTVTGPPGAGKTRLCRELAWRHHDRWRGGAWFCALAEARSLEGVIHVLAEVLGLEAGTVARTGEALAARGPVLLVLDNAEQVVEALAPALRDWLAGAPELSVLVSSREGLRIAGERRVELGELSLEEATALFEDRCQRPVEDVARIVAALDRLPLALELAAGMTEVLPPGALRERLSRPLDLLVGGRRDHPARHSSLRVALAGSWELLGPEEQRVLAAASLFEGGFELAGLEAVCEAEVLRSLQGLRARSLVRRPCEETGRYGLLVVVRAFAAERLAERPDAAILAEAHRAWVAAQAWERFGSPHATPTSRTRAWLARELDNVVVALERSLEAHPRDAAVLALAAYQRLAYRGPLEAAGRLLDQALAALRPADDALRARLLRCRANVHRVAGRLEAAQVDVDAAIAAARRAGAPGLAGRALMIGGALRLRRGEDGAAEAAFGEAVALLEADGDRGALASALGNRATALWNLGQLEEAEAAYTSAVVLHRELGNLRSAAVHVGNLGLMATETGDLDLGRARLHEALGLHRQEADRQHEAVTLVHLAWTELQGDETGAALACLEAAEGAALDCGDRLTRAQIQEVRAAVHWRLGALVEARAALREAARLYPRPSVGRFELRELIEACLDLDEGQPARARALLAQVGGARGARHTGRRLRAAEIALLVHEGPERAEEILRGWSAERPHEFAFLRRGLVARAG